MFIHFFIPGQAKDVILFSNDSVMFSYKNLVSRIRAPWSDQTAAQRVEVRENMLFLMYLRGGGGGGSAHRPFMRGVARFPAHPFFRPGYNKVCGVVLQTWGGAEGPFCEQKIWNAAAEKFEAC